MKNQGLSKFTAHAMRIYDPNKKRVLGHTYRNGYSDGSYKMTDKGMRKLTREEMREFKYLPGQGLERVLAPEFLEKEVVKELALLFSGLVPGDRVEWWIEADTVEQLQIQIGERLTQKVLRKCGFKPWSGREWFKRPPCATWSNIVKIDNPRAFKERLKAVDVDGSLQRELGLD
ncbi:hypothetical protein [Pararhodobacter sp.]|uniref:hypothetical protein n=1 Tax=Pararhodobacter sp. TaxID=2127056 RepID=UPI002FDE69EC